MSSRAKCQPRAKEVNHPVDVAGKTCDELLDKRMRVHVAERLRLGQEESMNPRLWQDLQLDDVGAPIIQEWDPVINEPDDGTRVLFGKRRTGKSWLCRWLLWLRGGTFPKGRVFSNTEHLNKWYTNFMPDKTVGPYSQKALWKVMQSQATVKSSPTYEWMVKQPGYENFNRCFIVLDDVVADAHQFDSDTPLNTVYTQGRHYDVDCYFNTQHMKAVPKRCRNNTDVFYVFKTDDVDDRECLWDMGGSAWGDEALFNWVFSGATEGNSTLVMCRSASDVDSLSQKFWHYQAPGPEEMYRMGLIESTDPKSKPKFRLCDQGLWQYQARRKSGGA